MEKIREIYKLKGFWYCFMDSINLHRNGNIAEALKLRFQNPGLENFVNLVKFDDEKIKSHVLKEDEKNKKGKGERILNLRLYKGWALDINGKETGIKVSMTQYDYNFIRVSLRYEKKEDIEYQRYLDAIRKVLEGIRLKNPVIKEYSV